MSRYGPGAGFDPDDAGDSTSGGDGGGTTESAGVLSGVPYGPASHSVVAEPRFVLDAPGPGLHVLLYDSAGYRKYLPGSKRWGLSWEINRRGGFGQGAVTAAALQYIAAGDRIDVYIDDHHHYRGYVEEADPSSDMPEQVSATLYGRSTLLGGIQVRSQLVYPSQVDAARIAADLWAAWGAPFYPWIATDFPDTGVELIGVFDYTGKSLSDAYNALDQACGDQVCWGCDIDGSGVDRVYFRPIGDLSSTDYSLPVPASYVGRVQGTIGIADSINIVTVTGGDLGDYAQKIIDGGFETPIVGGVNGSGNLLSNGSFESGSHQTGGDAYDGALAPDGSGGGNSDPDGHGYTDFWLLFGGASMKETGEDEDGSNAQDGNWWVETDDEDEGFSQVFRLPVSSRGHNVGVALWVRPEQDGGGSTAQVKLSYRDATTHDWTDDPSVSDTVSENPFNGLQPQWEAWEPYTRIFASGAYTTNCDMVRVTATQTLAAGEGQGLRWDSFCVWDNERGYQKNWQVFTSGTGEISGVDWLYTADRVEGGYAVRVTVSSADGTGNDAILTNRPQGANDAGAANLYDQTVLLLPVLGNQTVRLSPWVKAAPDAVDGQQITIELVFYKADKSTQIGDPQTVTLDTSDTSAADWLYMYLLRSAPSEAAYVYADIKFPNAGDWLIDGASLRDVRAPWGPTLPYQPAGDFSATFRASSLFAGLTDAVSVACTASESLYGPREGAISIDALNITGINDISLLWQQAQDAARAYLRPLAIPSIRIPVPVFGRPDLAYWPGSSCRLVGEAGEVMRPVSPLLPGLPIDAVRAEISDAGMLTRTVQLGAAEVTEDALTMQVAVAVAQAATRAARSAGNLEASS